MSAPTGSGAAARSAAKPASAMSTIAHEARQPLSTIESIAYYLSLVLPRGDEKVHEQLERIQRLVEQTDWILTSALQLAEPVPGLRESVDVEELMARAVTTRFPSTDPPAMNLCDGLPRVDADPTTAFALIDNLVMLFRTVATKAHPLTLRASAQQSGVAIEMETGVEGYRQEASLCPGAALSLASARRMVDAHGGSFELQVDPASGIRLRLMLP
jgi:signal transduction histidine kinase